MSAARKREAYRGRRYFLLGVMAVAIVALMWRAVDLQIITRDFLQRQGDARYLRSVSMQAHRGMIVDRNGEPLAISTPVDSVWVNPQEFSAGRNEWRTLSRLLDINVQQLQRRIERNSNREFLFLKRHLSPELAGQVMALDLPGLFLQREYRRYYPAGEVAGHVLGFTNVDDVGQEGLEYAYQKWLQGTPGEMRVVKDRLGRTVETVEQIREPVPGKDLQLSIDRRIQYLAYRELKAAVLEHKARGGSAVILDIQTGEILADVNQPAFNPNNRETLHGGRHRNQVMTDLFEPGSTVKPFTVAAALESGLFKPGSMIDTNPGQMRVGSNTIHDIHNYGVIDVSTVIQKSSNVGVVKMAFTLTPAQLWNTFVQVGLGASTGSGFPGEASGVMPDYHRWYPVDRASFSYGYGLSVTALQLARAYATLGAGGELLPLTLRKVDGPVDGRRVMQAKVAAQVLSMLETVVSDEGTAVLARVPGYRIAGKTGTVRKMGAEGYAEDSYLALFAGIAPVSRPRLAMVVVINDPRKEEFYGGKVAAPVFSRVMTGALRLLDVPPDDLPALRQQQAMAQIAGTL